MTAEDEIDNLQKVCEKLLSILKERQFGLMSWWSLVGDAMKEMKKCLDHSGVK